MFIVVLVWVFGIGCFFGFCPFLFLWFFNGPFQWAWSFRYASQAAAEGFFAYDCTVQADVLVIPLVLCHLGDAPMHAEISNTTNPSGTLNPCRTCSLTVESRSDKQTELYVQQFVGIGPFGEPVSHILFALPLVNFLVDLIEHHFNQASLPLRDWVQTRRHTHALWQLTRRPKTITLFDDLSKKYGIRDSLNLQFAKRIQSIYRHNKGRPPGEKVPKEAIVRTCEQLDSQFGTKLFNPFLGLAGIVILLLCTCSQWDVDFFWVSL